MARKDEISAGLLAFRRRDEIEFLLAHPGGPFWARKDDGAWTIPKGLVRPDDLLDRRAPRIQRGNRIDRAGAVRAAAAGPAEERQDRAWLRLRGRSRPDEIRQQHVRDGMAAALGPAPGIPGDRPDRLVRRARGDEKDHRLSAAVPGRAAGEACGTGEPLRAAGMPGQRRDRRRAGASRPLTPSPLAAGTPRSRSRRAGSCRRSG